jgi:hypothetical protein
MLSLKRIWLVCTFDGKIGPAGRVMDRYWHRSQGGTAAWSLWKDSHQVWWYKILQEEMGAWQGVVCKSLPGGSTALALASSLQHGKSNLPPL